MSTARPIDIPPCTCPAADCPPIEETAMTTTPDLAEAIDAAAVALYGPGLAARYRDYVARGVEAAAPLIIAAERERIARAMYACVTCGQPHEYRLVAPERFTWEHPDDGHAYQTALDNGDQCDLAASIARTA